MTTKRLPAEKRRKQILKSAIRVFARSTYHGATTKSISEEAGVTEALIYRYFGSKRDLFTQAIDHTSKRIVDGLEELLVAHRDDPVRAIHGCFAFYANMLNRSDDFAKMIFLVLAELDQEDIRQTYLPHQDRALKLIAKTLHYWRSQGYVPEDLEVAPSSWLFFGTYLILALFKHSHGNIELTPEHAIALARPYLKQEALSALFERAQRLEQAQTSASP